MRNRPMSYAYELVNLLIEQGPGFRFTHASLADLSGVDANNVAGATCPFVKAGHIRKVGHEARKPGVRFGRPHLVYEVQPTLKDFAATRRWMSLNVGRKMPPHKRVTAKHESRARTLADDMLALAAKLESYEQSLVKVREDVKKLAFQELLAEVPEMDLWREIKRRRELAGKSMGLSGKQKKELQV